MSIKVLLEVKFYTRALPTDNVKKRKLNNCENFVNFGKYINIIREILNIYIYVYMCMLCVCILINSIKIVIRISIEYYRDRCNS